VGHSLFPKHGCRRLGGTPVEEIIKAGPGVDHGPANLAVETAGMMVRMLLLGRGVTHPAIGADEIFGGPYAAGHLADFAPKAAGSRHDLNGSAGLAT